MMSKFWSDDRGGIAPLLALSIIPILGAVGAGVDYSRASAAKTGLQSALDSAVLYAAKDQNSNWQQVASNTFNAVLSSTEIQGASATFSKDASGNYVGQATGNVATRISGVLGYDKIEITAASAARAPGDSDNSCILTLDKKSSLSHVSMLFGGAPNIVLAACSTRSNTSLNCNGHSSQAAASWAAGSANGCSNPQSGARVLPDVYEALAAKITKECGGLNGGATWSPGARPASVKTVTADSYTAYHVCGDLTVSGSGFLTGATGDADSLIVIENGSLNIDNDAVIQTGRTTIILTGNNALPSNINFPKGAGKTGSLSLSPSQNPNNPWVGISLYQDPALTRSINNDWGPGAILKADGIIYLPNSEVELQGIASSNSNKCTKIVTGTFTTKGAVSINLSQETAGCKFIGMNQWADTPLHLVR